MNASENAKHLEWQRFMAAMIGPRGINERKLLEQEMLEREREWVTSHINMIRHGALAALVIGLWIWVVYAAVEAWM